MRLNLKQHVLDYEGKPLLANQTNSDGSPVLGEGHRPVQVPEQVRSYIALALKNTAQDEKEVFTPEQKTKIYELTTKLYPKKGNFADLTHNDCAFIEDRVGKVYGPLIYGRICDILEEREIDIPTEDDEVGEDGLVVKNADLSNVAAKDETKPPITPAKKR